MSNENAPLSLGEAAERILALEEPPQEEVESEPVEAEAEDQSVEVEAESDTEAEAEQAEEEVEETEDLAELAEYLAENREIYDSITIPTKIRGKEVKATLKDLVDAYQMNTFGSEELDSLKNQKQQFESTKQEQLTNLNQQLEQAKGLVQGLEQQFLNEFQQINWQELRETDPAEFSAKRQELLERQQGLQMAKQHIIQTQQSQFMQNYQSHIKEQAEMLGELIPEWSDDSVASKEKSEVRDYLLKQGVPKKLIDGELDSNGQVVTPGLSDAYAIAIARKAMLYDRGNEKVNVTKKKVKKLPKVMKTGKITNKDDIKTEVDKKKRAKLRKSGSVEDAASLIYDRMFGG